MSKTKPERITIVEVPLPNRQSIRLERSPGGYIVVGLCNLDPPTQLPVAEIGMSVDEWEKLVIAWSRYV